MDRTTRGLFIMVTILALAGVGVLFRGTWMDEPFGQEAGMVAAYRELLPAPTWWNPPDDGVTFLRGYGHQYVMLVYDAPSERVFIEIAQD